MITIFTPTYNRVYIIGRLYQSLLRQTVKNFEWVVVDDGSTDDTQKYFEKICALDNPFVIRFIKQNNGGKHRAINAGVLSARGELFFIVDSDDYLTDDAIEKIEKWNSELDNSHKFAGLAALRGYSVQQHIGGSFSGANYIDAKNTERKKYNLLGDKAEVYFTDILKKFPFPEFEGENFITEEVVWNEIAYEGYYLRWYQEIIYICEYLDDGLTKNGDSKNKMNPKGVLYWAKHHLKVYPNSFRSKLIVVNKYFETVKENKDIKQVAKDLGVSCTYCRLAVISAKFIRRLRKLFKAGNNG